MSNIVTALYNDTGRARTRPLYRYDYGQVLQINGTTLPETYEVHFSNSVRDEAVTVTGNANGVEVPDACLMDGRPVYAWLYMHTGEDDGETVFHITIPVIDRSCPSGVAPTPVERNIAQEALNKANEVKSTVDSHFQATGKFVAGTGSATANYAVAEGNTTTASGRAAHAEGERSTASGVASHAEGNGSQATTDAAHAEGCARAGGRYAHAEGDSALASGQASHAEGAVYEVESDGAVEERITTASGKGSHAEGSGTHASGVSAHAEGTMTTASGESAHSEGVTTEASALCAHAEGRKTKATAQSAHAEGGASTASNTNSHAEGASTTASGTSAHSEGVLTTASGNNSHAEGSSTQATGNNSHAEGQSTTASGLASHAEGSSTVANHAFQHVFGAGNIPDPSTAGAGTKGTYIEIVGNSLTSSVKSNARTLDWSGNEELAGDLTVNKGGANEASVSEIADDVSTLKSTSLTALQKQMLVGLFSSTANTGHASGDPVLAGTYVLKCEVATATGSGSMFTFKWVKES